MVRPLTLGLMIATTVKTVEIQLQLPVEDVRTDPEMEIKTDVNSSSTKGENPPINRQTKMVDVPVVQLMLVSIKLALFKIMSKFTAFAPKLVVKNAPNE